MECRFRDIHTVTRQLQRGLNHFETVGAWMLGADTDLTFVQGETACHSADYSTTPSNPPIWSAPRSSTATCSGLRMANVRRSISPATGSIPAAPPPCT